jgi:hypothetical protein
MNAPANCRLIGRWRKDGSTAFLPRRLCWSSQGHLQRLARMKSFRPAAAWPEYACPLAPRGQPMLSGGDPRAGVGAMSSMTASIRAPERTRKPREAERRRKQ